MTPSNKKPSAIKLSAVKGVEVENYNPKVGHWVLVNKKTQKHASSNNWSLALAALAVQKNDTQGIASLLPLKKAARLLPNNELTLQTLRRNNLNSCRRKARVEAKAILPALELLYTKNPSHMPLRKGNFCTWVVDSLENPNSEAYTTVAAKESHEILGSERKWRWWLDRLKKCRVKNAELKMQS